MAVRVADDADAHGTSSQALDVARSQLHCQQVQLRKLPMAAARIRQGSDANHGRNRVYLHRPSRSVRAGTMLAPAQLPVNNIAAAYVPSGPVAAAWQVVGQLTPSVIVFMTGTRPV